MIEERELDRAANDILDLLQERFDLPVGTDGFYEHKAYWDAWDLLSVRVEEYLNAIE